MAQMKPFEKAVSYMQGVMEEGTFCGGALAIGVVNPVEPMGLYSREKTGVVKRLPNAICGAERTGQQMSDDFCVGKDVLYVKKTWGNTSFTEEGTPVNENTLYDMASVTKIMSTTMVALRFIAQGKLDLADMLPRFFGDANVPDDKKGITVFHLMTHTAGYEASIRLEDRCRTPEEIVPYLLSVPLEYQPGTRVIYSCMGFILLAKILEKIGGRPLDELAREEAFEPLGMTHTGYHRLGLGVDYSENTAYTERNHRSLEPQAVEGCFGVETLSAPLRSALNEHPLDVQRPPCGRRISRPKDEDATRRGQAAPSIERNAAHLDGAKGKAEDICASECKPAARIRGLVGPEEWLVGEVHDENAYFQEGVSGNAGVFSDLNDCIRYARMLAGHGTLEGKVYLPRCIFDTAIRNYTPGMDENRGLGFHLANGYYSMSGQFFSQKGFGHNGYTGPHIFVDPDTGLYVVLLLNRVHPTRENAAHLRVRRILHTLLAVGMEELQGATADL